MKPGSALRQLDGLRERSVVCLSYDEQALASPVLGHGSPRFDASPRFACRSCWLVDNRYREGRDVDKERQDCKGAGAYVDRVFERSSPNPHQCDLQCMGEVELPENSYSQVALFQY